MRRVSVHGVRTYGRNKMDLTRRVACALLAGGAIISTATAEPIIVLIGGNHSDPSPAQLQGRTGRGGNSGLWRMKGDLQKHDQLPAEYFNWNGTRGGKIDEASPPGADGIAKLIRRRRAQDPDAKIILVGNSWGGHTAWQVCRVLNGETVAPVGGGQASIDTSAVRNEAEVNAQESIVTNKSPATPNEQVVDTGGKPESPTGLAGAPQESPVAQPEETEVAVDLVVFLDPSSFGRTKDPNPTVMPPNVRGVVNYFTRNTFSWNKLSDDPRIKNVDLGDPQNGFVYPGGPKYDSVLNWTAHVSAEWDERIHAEIRRQIRDAIGQADASP